MNEIEELYPGFVLVPDVLLHRFGPVTAVVWGRIYRYAREKGYSYASQEKIADEIGMSVRAVRDHIKILLKEGCIIDLTPDRKNKPHQYKPHMPFINTQQKSFMNYKKQLKIKQEKILDRQYKQIEEEVSGKILDNRKWIVDDKLLDDPEEFAVEENEIIEDETQCLPERNNNPAGGTNDHSSMQLSHSGSDKVAVEDTIEDTKNYRKNIDLKKEE